MISIEKLLNNSIELNEKGKHKETLTLLNTYTELVNANSDLLVEKSIALSMTDNMKLAIEICKQSINLNPNNSYALWNLGDYYFKLTNYEKAIEIFTKYCKKEPNEFAGLISLGNLHSKQENYTKARSMYRKAIDLAPNEYNILCNIGLTFLKQNNYKEAIEYFLKANSLAKNDPQVYMQIGNCYFGLKQYHEAKIHFKKSFDLINNSEIKQAIDLTSTKYKLKEIKKLLEINGYPELRKIINLIKNLLIYKGEYLCHYTSLTTTQCLLFEERKFRLSEATFFNDTSEGKEIFKFLDLNVNAIQSNEAKSLFINMPFIASFVPKTFEDNLSMWRLYGKEEKEEAKGCSITINKNDFLYLIRKTQGNYRTAKHSIEKDKYIIKFIQEIEEFNFYKVAYFSNTTKEFRIPSSPLDDDKLNRYLLTLKKLIKKYNFLNANNKHLANIMEVLNEIAFLFKTSEFQHENEVRLIINGYTFDKVIDHSYKVYLELININQAIESLVLGPRVEFANEKAAAFHYKLNHKNKNVQIFISNLPYK